MLKLPNMGFAQNHHSTNGGAEPWIFERINNLDKVEIIWKTDFSQLTSLWEIIMIGSYGYVLCHILSRLVDYQYKLSERPIEDLRNDIINLFSYVVVAAKKINMPQTLKAAKRARTLSQNSDVDIIHGLLKDIFARMIDELQDIKFYYINNSKIIYYNSKDLFGNEVCNNFSSTVYDIEEAGKCLALDRYTACVFHLMRIAEIGLRTLAWDRRINFKKKTPLELKDWDEILKGLEYEERQIQNLPKTLARDAQFRFYHGAMIELRAFKNFYRHRTMHGRENYDEHQSQSAFNHVSSFMKILASKISETKRTPKVWRKP